MTRDTRRAPFWFVVLLAALVAWLARSVAPALGPLTGAGAHDEPVQLAFWPIFIMLANAIWTGVQVAAKVALAILQYSVQILWRVATLLGKFVSQLGQWAWVGLKKAWHLLRATYDRVLKPAWQKVWEWVDKTQQWLRDTFEPVISWLQRVRKWVLDFYADFLRPILDTIDTARRALRVLGSLGVDWAKALDAKLGTIAELIDRPFRLALAKINEIINVVNRIVDANGLFQRIALIRSVERDIQHLSRAFANWRDKPLTAAQFEALRKQAAERTPESVRRDITEALIYNGGRNAALRSEVVQQVQRTLEAR